MTREDFCVDLTIFYPAEIPKDQSRVKILLKKNKRHFKEFTMPFPLEEDLAHSIINLAHLTVGMKCFSIYSSFFSGQTQLECLLLSNFQVKSDKRAQVNIKSQ
ncbi:hypothetical protein GOODEAATRI_004178 [Goodea atripinnis]|uniref:Uncharacterized protein n=1 Tax=Goodea atripinnis TaxID=208336 RepID=A0ABV0NIE5_9TELE